jgi:hypothetical protein
MFSCDNPYNLRRIFDMPEHCAHCGQKIELEPGFYYGAMYVSYAVTIAWLVAVWVLFIVLWQGFTPLQYLMVGIGSMILLQPVFFRLSRAIWLHMFVNYKPLEREDKKEI